MEGLINRARTMLASVDEETAMEALINAPDVDEGVAYLIVKAAGILAGDDRHYMENNAYNT